MELFKRHWQQNRQSKFVKIWNDLDGLSLKYVAKKKSGANVYMQQESTEHKETEPKEIMLVTATAKKKNLRPRLGAFFIKQKEF